MHKISTTLRGLLTLIFLTGASAGWAQITSDFSVDTDGWTVERYGQSFTNFAPTYSATGGNPGGMATADIFTVSNANASDWYWVAPSKYTGDLSAIYKRTLSFDLFVGQAGTDNTNPDVVILGSSGSLYYQFPTKPATGAWTSYSLPMDETQWHSGCMSCAAPSQATMKRVLGTVTGVRIRAKYLGVISASYVTSIDNVVMDMIPSVPGPVVTSFSPASALPGSSVTISGSGFDPAAAQNAVYFGGLRAQVTAASATQISALVPGGASSARIVVINLTSGQQGSSPVAFHPLYDNNKDYGGHIIRASMAKGSAARLSMNSTYNSFGGMDQGDLDGDGWTDMVVTETGTPKLYIFQHLGITGTVSSASFSGMIPLTAFPVGINSLSEVKVFDVDNDGKLDIVASVADNFTGYLAVFRNQSSGPGTLDANSFSAPAIFSYAYYSALTMAVGDLDGDGRLDVALTTGTSPGGMFVCRNLSTPGNADFAYGPSLGTTSGLSDVEIADLNGDGKPEIISPGYNAATISIYNNNSTPGTISMAAPFTIPAVVAYTTRVTAADLDNDGKTDLAWSTYGANQVYMAQNIYAGGVLDATAFGSTITIANTLANPNGITTGDINADGKPEIILSGSADVGILENIGTGSLSASSFVPTTYFQGSPTGGYLYLAEPRVADLDGDNKPEVFAVYTNNNAGENGVYIFHNECYPVPQVTSLTPASGSTGATVVLNGDLQFTGNVTPVVRLSGSLATISGAATNTATSITLSDAGVSGKFSVTNHGLTGFSKTFRRTFVSSQVIDNTSFAASVDFAIGFSPRAGLEVSDFNDDGMPEIVYEDTNGASVLQNSGTAGQTLSGTSFTDLANHFSAGIGAHVVDVDGDGKLDLATAYGLARNASSGAAVSFESLVYSNANSFTGATSADINKDGKLDIIAVAGGNNVYVFENLSIAGSFPANGNYAPFPTSAVLFAKPSTYGGVVAEDFDGDGYEDVIATNPGTSNLTFLLNTQQPFAINSGSLNFLGNYSTAGVTPEWITASDFDGDGKTDIAVTYSGSAFVGVSLNNSSTGDISFGAEQQLPSPGNGIRIASQDLDGDGLPEIVSIHQVFGSPSVTVFKNNSTPGNLNFSAGVTYALSRTPIALALGDVNTDGKPDIVITGQNGAAAPTNAVMVMQNQMPAIVITIDTQPGTTYSVCDGATPVLTTSASGTTNIAYQWQYSIDGVNYNDLADGAVYTGATTASLTVNTAGMQGGGLYRCKVTGDLAAAVYTNLVNFTVNALPATPVVSDVTNCGPGAVTLTASGGTNGNYFWYDSGGLINGESNDTYVTPSLVANASYQVSVTDGTCVSAKATVNAVIASIPSAPTASDVNICKPSQVTLTAGGGANGEYRWYNTAGVLQNGETAATYLTPTNELTTLYYVALNDGTCESVKTQVTVTLNPITLAAPQITTVPADVSGTVTICLGQTATLDGPAGFVYVWSTTESTQQISVTTSSTVTLIIEDANGCTSPASTVTVVANDCNQPPVITPATSQTTISGTATIDLGPLLSDPDNNLDVTTLKIVTQPVSGAAATINGQNQLVVDYAGISFVGKDVVTIEVCDLSGKCAQQQIEIDVAGEVLVYNGFSPNNDDKNPVFVIQNIDKMAETRENHVTIYDRWGDAVFETDNYDNTNHVFRGLNKNGGEVPAGTYFYKIEFTSGRKTMTGYLSLKR
ncbi:MAG: FG-GAP-like repeat-containing protein [Cyclobacteriaceae bacterium]